MGEQVPVCHIVDMNDVQSGVDIGGHAAGRRFDDHAAGRRRFDVARPNRGRRIDDDNRCRFFNDQTPDRFLREVFGTFVVPDHVFDRDRRILVRRAAVGGAAEHGDAAGVDDAEDAGGGRRADQVACAVDIWPRTSRPAAAPTGGSRPRHGKATGTLAMPRAA